MQGPLSRFYYLSYVDLRPSQAYMFGGGSYPEFLAEEYDYMS